jgi:hypothetical protein
MKTTGIEIYVYLFTVTLRLYEIHCYGKLNMVFFLDKVIVPEQVV